jgi:hypothetical protein
MTDNPNEPRVPDPPGDEPTTPIDPDDWDHWEDEPSAHDLGELTPLEDDIDGGRGKLLTRARLLVAAAAVVVLVGGAAFALKGSDDGNGGDDGVASLDGSGSDSDSDTGGSGSDDRPSRAEVEDAALKYADCMRDHGVDMPDPEFTDDGGVKMTMGGPVGKPGSKTEASAAQKKVETADQACKHFMDAVAPDRNMSPEEIAEMQDKQVKLAECMRDKGYDFPDPVVDDQGRVSTRIGQNDKAGMEGKQGEEKLQDDMESCSQEAGLDRETRGGGKA